MVQPLSPDGRLFATPAYSGQDYCAVHELDTGTRIATLPSATPRCWSPDGRRLAVVTHGTATWQMPGGIRTGQSGDYVVEVWEVQNTRTEQRFRGAPRDLAFSPDGKRLAASGFLLEMEPGERGPRFINTRQEPQAEWIGFGPSNRIVSANIPGRASLWVGNVKFEQMQGGIRDLKDPLPYITGFGLAPDGRHLLVAGYRHSRSGGSSPKELQFQVWDLDTGERVRRWLASTNAPSNSGLVKWSPDGQFIATTVFCERGLDVWEVATGRLVKHLEWTEPKPWVGQTIYDFWNYRRREPHFPYREFANAIGALAFTPDSRLVVSMTQKRLFVREAATGRVVAWHEFPRESVNHFALSPDGRTVAAVTHEGRVRLFDVPTLKERAWWTAHEAAGESVAFSADGQTLATGAADGTLRLWHLPTLRAGLEELGVDW
jgi:WD40 repeat protein